MEKKVLNGLEYELYSKKEISDYKNIPKWIGYDEFIRFSELLKLKKMTARYAMDNHIEVSFGYKNQDTAKWFVLRRLAKGILNEIYRDLYVEAINILELL
jgi:hypothetical protein